MNEEYLLKLEHLKLLEQQVAMQQGLPHLYGWPFYPWSKKFFESRTKESIICAANQISKSSTQIRRSIHWATAMDLWAELWPKRRPRQFWYLYPTRDVAHVEFVKKWKPEFLPRGEYEKHPIYGWKAEMYHNRIFAIHFNTDVSIYFKTYGQDVQDLQTGTVDYLALDEECPEELMSELMMRLAASDGYMSAVFTPTLGQEYWREAIEETDPKRERFPLALKMQVAMFDCLHYADGTRSPWTQEQINRAINSCKSEAEVQRRVFGKFVVDEGLKYPGFVKSRNVIEGHPLPKSWQVYCGVDPGSGGDNHPAAACFIGVSPDGKQGRIFRGWRGEGEITTVPDLVQKVIEMSKDLESVVIFYDHSSADFYNIATGMGLNVIKAEKSHAHGEQLLNALFKNQMLMGYNYAELDGLWRELATLKKDTPKTRAKDDYADALRYAVSKVNWDWESIRSDIVIKTEPPPREKTDVELRRGTMGQPKQDGLISIEDELNSWNELMETEGYSESYGF